MDFPPLSVRDLEGHDYMIPHELPGGPHIILLAFQQWHQNVVDRWTPHLKTLAESHPGTEVWEVPSISKGYRLFRSGIDGGMRAGIPDKNVRQHTLTAYTDLGKLASALNLDSLDALHVLLVDCTGEVLFHDEGEPSERAITGLESAIQAACG